MKYITIILLIFLLYVKCIAENQQEQQIICRGAGPILQYYGILFGVNKANLNNTIENLSTDSKFGINVGIELNHFLGDEFKSSILSRISYISNGIDYIIKNPETDISNFVINENDKYFQLSSSYQFNFITTRKMVFKTFLGPYFNYLLYDINSKNNSYFNNKSFNKYEFGLSLGAGFDFIFNDFILGIEYNYQFALTDKYNYNDNYIRSKSHFINFIFSPKIRF